MRGNWENCACYILSANPQLELKMSSCQFSHLASYNIYGDAVIVSALTFALESLSEDAVEHGAAVVAERRRGVGARLEPVRHVELEPLSHQL